MLLTKRHFLRLNVFLLHDGGYRGTSSIGLNFTPSYILSIHSHQKSQSLLQVPPLLILKSPSNDIKRPLNEPYINPEASSTSPLISGQHQAQSHYLEHTYNGLMTNSSFARHYLGFHKSRSHIVVRIKLLILWISSKNLSLHISLATLRLIMQAQMIHCLKR